MFAKTPKPVGSTSSKPSRRVENQDRRDARKIEPPLLAEPGALSTARLRSSRIQSYPAPHLSESAAQRQTCLR
ncbi:Hypothetical predicted protein, partial [Marmota monax]